MFPMPLPNVWRRTKLLPAFKNGDYYGGIDAATSVLISLLEGEFTPDQYRKQSSSRRQFHWRNDLYDHPLLHPLRRRAQKELRHGRQKKQPAPLAGPGHDVGRPQLRQLWKLSREVAVDSAVSAAVAAAPLEAVVPVEAGKPFLLKYTISLTKLLYSN